MFGASVWGRVTFLIRGEAPGPGTDTAGKKVAIELDADGKPIKK
jgi:hypothetical protein